MRIQLKGPGHAANLLADLNRCRQMRQYCDAFLQVGSRTFAAHRAVLACSGTYFHTLFTRPPATASAYFTLEFISPLNFEKVLTFIYTGEILIDLIDVGVLYELAERLGISELMRACHTTFPDLQASVSAKVGSSGDFPMDPDIVSAASEVTAITAPSVCSSSASCSSLSSSAGPSAAPTPSAASSPLFQVRTTRTERKVHTMAPSPDLKTEDVQSHISCGQIATNVQLQESPLLPSSSVSNQMENVLPPGPVLHLKSEPDLLVGEATGGGENCVTHSEVISESAVCSLLRSSNPTLSDSSSLPDSSAEPAVEACAPSPSSENLQVVSVEGATTLMLGKVETEPTKNDREVLQGNLAMTEAEEEFPPWRQIVGEIIELSDDETYMEEREDEDDEDELVCVENDDRGEEGNMSQVTRNMSCKACSAPLSADPFSIRKHGESHLTELGLCRVCGESFPDHSAAISHALSHIGLQLFTCDMCHLQFCSRSKLLRHHHQTASSYSLPQETLNAGSQNMGSELKCAVCTKTLSKNFQTVRDHLLTHVCYQSLDCGVCHHPQLSLCSLLWHALTHLSLPVFSCPHCACCFVERLLLDRHMIEHAKEAAAEEREHLELGLRRAEAGAEMEEMHCFLCPQTFSTSSAFQCHLSLHTTNSQGRVWVKGWSGKRKADQTLEGPSSSCSSSTSLQDTSRLSKISTLGLGFSVPEKFFQGPSLSSAILINGSSAKEGEAENPGVRGKWYRCRYCGKRFAHSGEFTYHLRIHTGEKPYQCKVCLRFFRGRSTMICHLKTHAGALMYRCTVCGFYFSTLKLVSSHMELHKEHLPPDFNIEQTFMYNDHSKEPLPPVDT